MRRILVTGGSGYLGRELLTQLRALENYKLHATCFSTATKIEGVEFHQLDLRDAAGLIELLEQVQPEIIFHTAATMGGDALLAPDLPGEAEPLILNASRTIARWASHEQARMIHLSTDVVFSGNNAPYHEGDLPHPIHRYGAAKRKAEIAILLSRANSAIVRTSLIYGFDPPDARTKALLDGTMRRLFTDEYRNPIHVADLARAVIKLIDVEFAGILHIAGPERLSRYEFGQRIAKALDIQVEILPALASESVLIRPKDCTLNCELVRALLPDLEFTKL